MFFAVIIMYSPDYKHVNNMCVTLANEGINVILYDNTPKDQLSREEQNYINNDMVYYLTNGTNDGLSVGYTEAIKYVEESYGNEGIEGFLFYDQDSTILKENLTNIFEEYNFIKSHKLPLGILGARPINSLGEYYDVHQVKNQQYYSDKFIEVEFVISSFSLVPYSTIKKIGYFDQKLFIDLVDSEYSFRCTKNGLLNLMSRGNLFTHEVGERKGTLFGIKSFAISSPIRNYYQVRNLILVGRDYGWYFFIIKKVSKRLIQVVLSAYYSGHLLKRIYYVFKGMKDGVLYKGGRIDDK